MSTAHTLAFGFKAAGMMIERYCSDLTAEEYVFRSVPESNCVAWTLGHLTLSNRSLVKSFGVSDLDELPEGFEQRFGRKDGAPAASDFGDVSKLLMYFHASNQRVVEAIQNLSEADLSKVLEKPVAMANTVEEKLQFMVFHSGQHTGQITMIRRALGRPILI